jgi:hypothetical protein
MPACTSTANVTEVYMSLDEQGFRRRNVFFTDSKKIVCIAEAGIGRDNVTLEITIRRVQSWDGERFVDDNIVTNYEEQNPPRTDGRPALFPLVVAPVKITPDGRLVQDDEMAFPAGRYQCEVLLDGKLEGTAIFNVDFPPCPTAFISPGDKCQDFYKEGTTCPIAGREGAPQPTCACEKGKWACK